MVLQLEKHPKGLMVVGRVFCSRSRKIKFRCRIIDSCAYKQTFLNYQKDIEYLKYRKNLMFQQDNAPSHTS